MVVLDASALLALLFDEPGAERVGAAVEGGCMSTLNLAEVLTRIVRDGHSSEGVLARLAPVGIEWVPFEETDAARAAELWPSCHEAGLSLGDRACIALALGRNLPALTADQAWGGLELPVEIQLIR